MKQLLNKLSEKGLLKCYACGQSPKSYRPGDKWEHQDDMGAERGINAICPICGEINYLSANYYEYGSYHQWNATTIQEQS